MTAAVSKTKGFNALPNNAFLHALTFLEPTQVARIERVCKQWKGAIKSEDQHIWKEFCLMQKTPVVSADLIKKELEQSDLGLHVSGCGTFPSQIVEIIIAYMPLHEITTSAAVNYKQIARLVCADIRFDWETSHIYVWPKNSWNIEHDWGNDKSEPFVRIRVRYGKFSNKYTSEDMIEDSRRKKTESALGFTPVWLQSFPTYIPLRFFMKRDGTLKDGGDTLQFVYCGRMLRLTCQNEFEHRNGELFSSTFKEGLEKRLDICRNAADVKDVDITFSKVLASIAHEWFYLWKR